MIKLRLNDNEYNLPLYPDEISIRQGVNIKPYLKDDLTTKDKINIISILANANYIDFNSINPELIDKIFSKLPYVTGEGTYYLGKSLRIGRDIYSVRTIEDMTLLEWIDLTLAFRDPDVNAEHLASVLLRKAEKRDRYPFILFRNFKSCGFKPYYKPVKHLKKYDGQVDTKLVDNVGYFTFSQIVIEALTEVNRIVQDYPKIYGTDDKADKLNRELHPELYAKDDYKDDDSNKKENSPLSIWGLYDLLSSSCNDVKSEIDYWLNKPFREFLEHSTYIITKQELNNK